MATPFIVSAFDGLEGNGTLDNRLVYWLSMEKWSIDEAAKILSNIVPDQSSINLDVELSSLTLFTGQQIPDHSNVDENGYEIDSPVCCSESECLSYKNDNCVCWGNDKFELLKYIHLFNDINRLLARSFDEDAYVLPNEAIDFILSKKIDIPWLEYALTRKLLPTNANSEIPFIVSNEASDESSKSDIKPLSRHLFQEQEILRVIDELGYVATKLPKREAGKSGIKAKVRNKLSFAPVVFNKAWERLRAYQDIKEE